MGLDTLLALGTLAALAYYGFKDAIRPLLTRGGRVETAESVNTSAPRRLPRLRSRRSARSNAANVGSPHSSAAGEGSNVRPNVQSSPAIAPLATTPTAPAGAVVLTQNELQQLAIAVAARAGGATLEAAILEGFGAKKGSSAGYKRAHELLTAACQPPQPAA